jgi:PAS domain S-box-containing protein
MVWAGGLVGIGWVNPGAIIAITIAFNITIRHNKNAKCMTTRINFIVLRPGSYRFFLVIGDQWRQQWRGEQEGRMNPSGDDCRKDVILDSINEGVFTVDEHWRVTAFNRAAERITGVDRQEAVGRACCDVFHADICEKDCALRRTFETGKPIVNATAHIVNQHGQQVPIRLSTAILQDRRGRVIGGVETFQDLSQVRQLQKELHGRYTFQDIVGRSDAMMRLFEILPQIADSSSTVLIEGPSGTGKELFARAIHNLSPRRQKRFVAVNCAALPDTLLESELFGHKAGAFTDAKRDKAGRFALADGGTVFLDEIGDISPALQVRLLRVLQERVIEPLGAVEPVPVNVRVVAANNKSLAEQIRSGAFREDLFYRIRVIHLVLPGLRQRREDIPLLVDHLIAKFNHLQGKDIAGISADAMARLMNHDFPGNVRELENIIEQAFVLCQGGIIGLNHLPLELQPRGSSPVLLPCPMTLKVLEKDVIAETLQRCNGNRRQAARTLGIDPSTLYRKLKALPIAIPGKDGRSRPR